MFNQISFGEKLKSCRKEKNLTQEEVAEKIKVSAQAISKWEKGECLPDAFNLKLLGRFYRISIDSLLDLEDQWNEKIIETIKIGNASFEVIEKAETILAGKILYAKEFGSIEKALETMDEKQRWIACEEVIDCILPICDITLSVNFWLDESRRAMGFVRETTMDKQSDGIDIYKMPASLYIRAYTDRAMAQLIAKEQCDIWELFSYIRNYFMPANGFKMAENGAQELEVFDTSAHKTGYAYMPVMRK
jgi:transcriptional regulator with XRE-family HTH domain